MGLNVLLLLVFSIRIVKRHSKQRVKSLDFNQEGKKQTRLQSFLFQSAAQFVKVWEKFIT